MDTTTLDLSALTEDGNVLKLGDGRVLRLRVEPDECAIEDLGDYGDCWGRTAWADERTDDYGHQADRPDGFDGNAEKLHVGRGYDAIWWQPPSVEITGGPKRGKDGFTEMRRQVQEILEYGFQGMIVELLDGVDAYGRPIVADVASLWGIEPFADEAYRAGIVNELVGEIGEEG